ncbi:GDP-mannose:cellobiosyl-diphosphopolyprenol alpha-mannosyltransferase [Methylobacterium gregans]|uniref:GDP-mannose:cellobiosyl-diphosphopolyprenol alpha-mannosyltransferase n=3 Tax=Methylobacterium gregans TaxID=374424 RepID=A0AA37MAL3_9HYPH|nr:GDP-mannose:cellobiosyl-diphosphopolyprenol alpha-mannosyltransferase [Methylobacterium gregans]
MGALRAEEAGWQLRIVGVPSDLSVADLASQIDAAGLGGAVSVHAGLDAAGVRALIGEASLFVSASEYEGFGIALIEAMSAGLVPVVHPNASFTDLAARHPGIALCDFAEPAAAARAVRAAHAKLAARGRPPSEDLARYAWAGVAARYLDTYAQVRRAA